MKEWTRTQVNPPKPQKLFSVENFYFSFFSFGWTFHSRLMQNELMQICHVSSPNYYLPSSWHKRLVKSISLAKTPAVIFVCQTPRLFSDRWMVCSQVTVLPNSLFVCAYHASVVLLSHWIRTKIQLIVMKSCKNDAQMRPGWNIWLSFYCHANTNALLA